MKNEIEKIISSIHMRVYTKLFVPSNERYTSIFEDFNHMLMKYLSDHDGQYLNRYEVHKMINENKEFIVENIEDFCFCLHWYLNFKELKLRY